MNRKTITLAFILFSIVFNQNATAQLLKEKDKLLTIGIGSPRATQYLWSLFVSASEHAGVEYRDKIIPITLKYEFMSSNTSSISITGTFYKFMRQEYTTNSSSGSMWAHSNNEVTASRFKLVIRENKYYRITDDYVWYWGRGIGLILSNAQRSISGPDLQKSIYTSLFPVSIELTTGFQAKINKRMLFFLEGGFSTSCLQAGLSIKY